MNSDLYFIKSLATTLLTEIDLLNSKDLSETEDSFDLAEKVREFEIKLIKTALFKTRGNQRRAAQLLGIKKSTLHNKIKNYEISYFKISDD